MSLFNRFLEAGPDEVVVGFGASPLRRVIGTGALLLLCAVFLRQGYDRYLETGGGVWLILLAAVGVYAALRFWHSSATGLELTPTELRDTRGRQLVRLDDIVSVNRDIFAMVKPTNGFVIETRDKLPGAFIPGIWWRYGRRIGIGGLTGPGEGKAVAELLQQMLNRRDRDSRIHAQ